MGAIVLGDDDQAAGLFIEPMHNARPQIASRRRQRLKVMQQGIHQCPLVASIVGRACAGMHHHSGRLVDHREVGIFKDNVKGISSGTARSGGGCASPVTAIDSFP